MKRETIKKRRTEITVETSRRMIFQKGQKRQKGRQEQEAQLQWCAACAQTVTMLTPEQAAIVAGVSARTIYRWIEAGRAHFDEAPDGVLRVCSNSLQAEPP